MGTLALVGSWNAGPAAELAASEYARGTPLLRAIVAGIGLIEDDPEEMSVGFGGLPNEDGEVELDAAVMDGPRHKAGAVAGLRRVRRAAALALEVLERTDHALLVGEGALKFARQMGFVEENLLTPKARDGWLAWKAGLSPRDAWLGPEERPGAFGSATWAGHQSNPTPGGPPTGSGGGGDGLIPTVPPVAPFTFGTVHLSGVDERGDVFACTSTSGLSYKIPGRVGDSPIPGAGLYADNAVGAAGATGRGESTLQNCAAYEAVRAMEQGMEPGAACVHALRRLASRTREPRLLEGAGRPAFNVTMYAVRKDGLVGAASIKPGYQFVRRVGGVQELAPCIPMMSAS